MSQQYASKQPAGFKNYIENVAIVGAGGSVGKFLTEALVAGKKHRVTAITRQDSSNKLPEGVEVVKVDYDDHSSLVSALKGQDFLIITMGVTAPPGQEAKLIKAAAEAGILWVMPNDFGGDCEQEQMGKDTFLLDAKLASRKLVEELGVSAWVGFCCGFWYEFSLGGGAVRYGFDFEDRSVVFYDDGNAKISTTSWPQCGRAIASLLSLKVLPHDENDKSTCLDNFRNKSMFISSFLASQKDMFASVLKVTDTTEKDWKISYETSKERYQNGLEKLQSGDRSGFGQLLYARVFYPTGEGDHSSKLHNDVLGLPKEDFDECTKEGVRLGVNKLVLY